MNYTPSAAVRDPLMSQPVGYSLLLLPSKKELRKKGYNVAEVSTTSSTRNHPLAYWETRTLKVGATHRDALDAVEEANRKTWGLLKARIQFSCGSFETFVRTNPNDPTSLKCISTYDPNGVFREATREGNARSRAELLPRLCPLVDDRGHHLSTGANPPRSFHPQVLYRSCPPPILSQAGYDFTPMSHNAFLLRPREHSRGVRDVKGNFMRESCDYRPRAYLREQVSGGVNSRHCHCAEVHQVGDYTMDLARDADVLNNRNRVCVQNVTKKGTVKPNSTIVGRRCMKAPRLPCAHDAETGACTNEADCVEATAGDQLEVVAPSTSPTVPQDAAAQ
ncbi:hypothetical protein ERJ75_000835600 [Trypanosoma vivax]|nr:hypothetical protein TRVL_01697 [Trypanosoma vivax]KAH8613084.1 hypothetical protein ERJ75_000835600 [Trypanosoma vivax]